MNAPQLDSVSVNTGTALEGEMLTASDWVELLNVGDRAFRKRCRPIAEEGEIGGRLVQLFRFSALPPDYQKELNARRLKHGANSFRDLLDMRRVERRRANRKSNRSWLDHPASARARAVKRREVMRVYFSALDLGRSKTAALELAAREHRNQFHEEPGIRTLRTWAKKISDLGGYEWAKDEDFCDGKSCRHVRATNKFKLGLPDEFLAEWQHRTLTIGHLQQAYYSLVQDWLAERDIPGLGVREDAKARFPYSFEQLRAQATGVPARKLATRGKAHALASGAIRYVHTTAANLRACEYLLLDDTRIDIIAANERTGAPVELKAYILMDGASRRILGYIVKEEEALLAEDVWALLAQVLSSTGLPVGYPIHLKFERGAVACAPATETLLRSIWPGRICVHRTSMDGGRNRNPSDFFQQPSGHWMGKAHIESFMRTLAMRLEHIAGQRGGDYRRQPAQLGLIGKDRRRGILEYTQGSQLQESTRSALAQRVVHYLQTGDLNRPENETIEFCAGDRRLRPVRWVRDAIQEAVAFYNELPSRAEGFAIVESQCPETNRLLSRPESPRERYEALLAFHSFERIASADAARLLTWRGRAVTVTPQGVTFDCAPWKGLNFWRENSPVINAVQQLTKLKRKLVALVDEETLRRWTPDEDWRPVIHLIGDVNADAWKPGMEGRYLDTLPLATVAGRANPETQAEALAEAKRELARAEAEILYASRGVLPKLLVRARQEKSDIASVMEGNVIRMPDVFASDAAPSELADLPTETRRSQREQSEHRYAAGLPMKEAQKNEF